jgi:uncharacterized protein (TIGR02444 family)
MAIIALRVKKPMKHTLEEKFWAFSCELYERPHVKSALLSLQRHAGLNVNLLLFCGWAGVSGLQQLRVSQLKRLMQDSYAWHDQIVLSLRRLRRATRKGHRKSALYDEVCAQALLAERMEQGMLLVHMPLFKRVQLGTCKQQLQRVCHNVLAYMEVIGLSLTVRQRSDLLRVVQALFGHLPPAQVAQRCMTVWSGGVGKQRPRQMTFSLPVHRM